MNIISLIAYLLFSLVIVQGHNQSSTSHFTHTKPTSNGHQNSNSKISHTTRIHTTKHPTVTSSGKNLFNHKETQLVSTRVMSKIIPTKVSNMHTPRSSATTAILKLSYHPTQTLTKSSNFQTKLQPFASPSLVHTTQSQNTNYPTRNYSTLLSGAPTPSTAKRQDNITKVQNEVNKMDVMRTEIASTHPSYQTHMRYIIPEFGFNLDKMIAELANDSDKEVAALFTTSTVASTTSYIPYVSLQNWQYMFPNIFNRDPSITTFSVANKNTPIDSFTQQYPRTTQPIQNLSTIQLIKHEIQQQTPTIDSTENFMEERIKKLQQLKPLVLSLVRNASRNHFLRDTLQTHLMESENMRPLQIHTREIPANSNKVTTEEPSTELQPQLTGYRRKIYQAKLILEELPFEYNMQVKSDIKHQMHDMETNTHASSTHSLIRSSYSEANGTPKSEKMRESSTTNSKIKSSNTKTVSNNFSKQNYSSSIPGRYNKIIKKYIF